MVYFAIPLMPPKAKSAVFARGSEWVSFHVNASEMKLADFDHARDGIVEAFQRIGFEHTEAKPPRTGLSFQISIPNLGNATISVVSVDPKSAATILLALQSQTTFQISRQPSDGFIALGFLLFGWFIIIWLLLFLVAMFSGLAEQSDWMKLPTIISAVLALAVWFRLNVLPSLKEREVLGIAFTPPTPTRFVRE